MNTWAERAFLFAALIAMGAAWGFTQPMSKSAVSTGYQHFGLIFWQLVIGAVALGIINAVRGVSLPMGRVHLWFYLLIAMIGSILPGAAMYQAIEVLPSGIVSILLSLIPMLAFPVALMWRLLQARSRMWHPMCVMFGWSVVRDRCLQCRSAIWSQGSVFFGPC
jgi:drug/metabolite transporter (DMT)-like permease